MGPTVLSVTNSRFCQMSKSYHCRQVLFLKISSRRPLAGSTVLQRALLSMICTISILSARPLILILELWMDNPQTIGDLLEKNSPKNILLRDISIFSASLTVSLDRSRGAQDTIVTVFGPNFAPIS